MTRPIRPPGLTVLTCPPMPGTALIDSGEGRKLERFGPIVVDRPEPQALWPKAAPQRWASAHAVFSATSEDEEKGRWRIDRPVADAVPVDIEGVRMVVRLGSNWHIGLFPEQAPHWAWMREHIAARALAGQPKPRVLNLFAYTGAASLIAAKAGAEVVHVDASKKAVAWGRDCQAASALGDAPIRWIVEDARKFVAREVRRGRTYDVILLDPPKFGRGPEHEVWDLFEHLAALMRDVARLLAPGRSRLVLTAYAIRASALALDGLARAVLPADGTFECGELALAAEADGPLLPTSLFVRYEGGGAGG